MEDLLTTRQVLEYLKVDRITVYRMLNDGRLKGIKIGQHWRFQRREVERLLNGEPAVLEVVKPDPKANFPTHCVQTIQDLFSDVGQVNALTVDTQGEPLTEVTGACSFCELIQRSPEGLKACQAAWQMAASGTNQEKQMHTCHAGLQYVFAPIVSDGELVGTFLAGRFYWQTPDPGKRPTGCSAFPRLMSFPSQNCARLPTRSRSSIASSMPGSQAGRKVLPGQFKVSCASAPAL